MKVQTTKGMIERSELAVKDVVTDEENARVIATEWRHQGKIVRRDVSVSILRGLEMTGEKGSF